MPDIFLTDFRIARPAREVAFAETVDWLVAAHATAEGTARRGKEFDPDGFRARVRRSLLRVGGGPEAIATRGVEVPDVGHNNWEEMEIFRLDRSPTGLGIEARARFFERAVDRVLEWFYPPDREPPGSLVHVTCTGYLAPSPVQKLVARRGWTTEVTHAYHMGCYAAIPAIRTAAGVSTSPLRASRRPVDIVHTELCALHLDPATHTLEQLVVQSLFADGYATYSLHSHQRPTDGLRVLALRERIIPDSLHAMSWVTAEFGLRMTLDREVPALIRRHVTEFTRDLFAAAGLDFEAERETTCFAVHPGGPRIIDHVAEILRLAPEQVAASRGVLRDYGNMSSATLPHVWHRLVGDAAVVPGTRIVSLAFGPGLTVCGALFEKL